METWQAVAIGIIPSVGVGLLFWFVIRAVIRADRNERAALAEEEARLDAAAREDVQGDDASAGSPAGPNSGKVAEE